MRADAAVVYRALRDGGPGTARELADRCFPVAVPPGDSAHKALLKVSVRRVLDSVVWMRAAGVEVWCVPSRGFSLTAEPSSPSLPAARETRAEDVSRDTIMDVWHAS